MPESSLSIPATQEKISEGIVSTNNQRGKGTFTVSESYDTSSALLSANDNSVLPHIISTEELAEIDNVIIQYELIDTDQVIEPTAKAPIDHSTEIPQDMLSLNRISMKDMVDHNHNVSLESMIGAVVDKPVEDMFTKEPSVLLDNMIDHSIE